MADADVVQRVLTDGSHVYDVTAEAEDGAGLQIGCVTYQHARVLAHALDLAVFVQVTRAPEGV